MARKLGQLEYFETLGKILHRNPEFIQDEWEKIIDFWIDELQQYGVIYIPYFGDIRLTHVEERDFHVPIDRTPENKGKSKIIHMEAYDRPYVKTTDGFKDNINNRSISRAEIRRQRAKVERDKLKAIEYEKQKEQIKRSQEMLEEIKLAKKIKKKKEQKIVDECDYVGEE